MAEVKTTAGLPIKVLPIDANGTPGIISVSPASALVHGQQTVGATGTEVALGPNTVLKAGVRVKAFHANTGMIYVGRFPVTATTGYVLDSGEEVFLEVSDLAHVYIDASVNGEGVSYIGS